MPSHTGSRMTPPSFATRSRKARSAAPVSRLAHVRQRLPRSLTFAGRGEASWPAGQRILCGAFAPSHFASRTTPPISATRAWNSRSATLGSMPAHVRQIPRPRITPPRARAIDVPGRALHTVRSGGTQPLGFEDDSPELCYPITELLLSRLGVSPRTCATEAAALLDTCRPGSAVVAYSAANPVGLTVAEPGWLQDDSAKLSHPGLKQLPGGIRVLPSACLADPSALLDSRREDHVLVTDSAADAVAGRRAQPGRLHQHAAQLGHPGAKRCFCPRRLRGSARVHIAAMSTARA